MKLSLRGSIRLGHRGGRNPTSTTKLERRRTRIEKSVFAEEGDSEYGQIAFGVWLRPMKVEAKDVDSRRYRRHVGWSPVSTAECNGARSIRESKYVRSPLDTRRLDYYRPKVDSRHKRSEPGAKERSSML